MGRSGLSISAVWFFCLGGLGIFYPFYSLYLHENAGLSGSQVGAVMAILPLVGIAAQPLWGQIGDRTGSRTWVLAILGLGASLGYAALYFAQGFASLLLGTAALAVFSTALLPSCVAVTLALSRTRPHAFGLIRVWGTVGFFILVVSFPTLLHAIQRARGLVAVPGGPSEPGLEVMFPMTGAVVLVGALLALTLPRGGALSLRASRGDWRQLLRHGPFVRLLVFVVAAFLCIQGPMTMFPIYVRAHGGTIDSVSRAWIFMLLLEIPLVALFGAIVARIGRRGVLAMGIFAVGLRWTVCGLATGLAWWIYPVQALHGVVIAGLVLGAPFYVDAVVPERLRSTGQGMLAMMGISIGGISSTLGSGWLIEHVSADAPYLAGGIGALILGCLLPLLIPPARRPESEEKDAAEG